MSHFAVAVITTPDGDVDEALAPFHEYECTGVKDQYVISSSNLEYLQEQYEEQTVSLMKNDKADIEKGEKVYLLCDDPLFVRDPYDGEVEKLNALPYTERNNHPQQIINIMQEDKTITHKIRDLEQFPEWKLTTMPCTEVFDLKTFANWYYSTELPTVQKGEEPCDSWGEWLELDENGQVIDFFTSTNPNAKWDWYVIGGRWENMLRTKQGELVNSCTLGELDFETQIKELTKKAHEIYDTFEKCLGDLPKNWMSWKDVLADQQFNTIEERRNFYHNQVQIKAIKANDTNNLFWAFGYDIDSFMVDRETYVSLYAGKPFSTYAVLDATDSEIGTWHGSDIGMWGITLREEENWEEKNQRLLRSFPSDYVITIVDCHI